MSDLSQGQDRWQASDEGLHALEKDGGSPPEMTTSEADAAVPEAGTGVPENIQVDGAGTDRYEGYGGTIEITDDALVLTRSGLMAKISGAGTAPRRIPFGAISAVTFTDASWATNGWLQLGLGGQAPPTLTQRTVSSDPDTLMFRKKDNDRFIELHERIKEIIGTNQQAGVDPSQVQYDRVSKPLLAKSLEETLSFTRRRPLTSTTDESLMAFQSHVSGVNANVRIYPDRIEWEKRAGMFMRRETSAIPTRMIQNVTTSISGIKSSVTIYTAGGEPVEMRVSRREADRIQELVLDLIRPGGRASAPPTPPPPAHVAGVAATPSIGIAEELRQLAELKDSGILTEEEFAAQKARLLGNSS